MHLGEEKMIIQHPTAIAETTIAETTAIEDKLSKKKLTVLEEIELIFYWF